MEASKDQIKDSNYEKTVSFHLDQSEFGISSSKIDIHFHPSEYGILDKYSVEKEIYRLQLSPTIITLTRRKRDDK